MYVGGKETVSTHLPGQRRINAVIARMVVKIAQRSIVLDFMKLVKAV